MPNGLAPVNYYGTVNSTRPFPALLYGETDLFDDFGGKDPKQRETTESLAELYSVIVALDYVEKAYLRDSIQSSQYTAAVNKLLAQYKTYLSDSDVQREFVSLEEFKERFHITASNAITRLERGIPVTVEHAIDTDSGERATETDRTTSRYAAKNVAETTGNFITAMDALKLNYNTRDQLHPLLAELLLSINRVTRADFEHRAKLVEWIIKVNKMRHNDALTDAEVKQLLFDLDAAYRSFYGLLD